MEGALLGLALAGCGHTGIARNDTGQNDGGLVARAGPSTATPGDAAPYDTHLPMGEFMTHVMQHAGDGVWKWQGVILDRTGEHSLYPTNDEEWEDAESGALTLAESTNLLLIPGRRVAEPEWDDAVREVRRIALKAAKAAEKHDAKAFLAAGSALDDACDICHVRYDPNFKTAPR